MEKPQIMITEELKGTIAKTISESGIALELLFPIMENLCNQSREFYNKKLQEETLKYIESEVKSNGNTES